jgi:hypothetical protein
MKKTLHQAFWLRYRDRAAAIMAAAVAIVPMGAPREIADWIAQQAPWCPSWLHWVISGAIVIWRLDAGRRAAK